MCWTPASGSGRVEGSEGSKATRACGVEVMSKPNSQGRGDVCTHDQPGGVDHAAGHGSASGTDTVSLHHGGVVDPLVEKEIVTSYNISL